MIAQPSNYLCSLSQCIFLQYRQSVCGFQLHCTHPMLTRSTVPWALSRCPKGKAKTPNPEQDDRPDHIASLGGY